MDYLSYYKRLQYLKSLIEKGNIHSPKDLIEKFNCSEKTIRNMINRLREDGTKIIYCKKAKKYIIEN
jgi:biotin operon repressor